MTQTFVKRQNTYNAIQFTGGRKNAMEIIKWFNEEFGFATRYETIEPPNLDGGEFFFLRSERYGLGTWFIKDAFHGKLSILTQNEFEKMFELSEEAKNFDVVRDGAQESPSGIEISAEDGVIRDVTTYNEDTLFKVLRALMDCRVGQPQAEELIQSMQNAGILFRERI